MNNIQKLSRNEMKYITAGLDPDDNCHRCCWDDDDDNCSGCANGTSCETGAHTHKCPESECAAPVVA